MTPTMKIFRWILSHLTLIIVFLLIIYFIWNLQKDDAVSSKTKGTEKSVEPPLSVNEKPDISKTAELLNTPEAVNRDKQKNSTKHVIIDTREAVPDLQAFSERKRQFQLGLSMEQHQKQMTYKHVLQSRDQLQELPQEPEMAFPDEKLILNPRANPAVKKVESQTLPQAAILRKGMLRKGTVSRQMVQQKNILTQNPTEAVHFRQVDKQDIQERNLQEQLRSRQKQLSHQMVSLLAANSKSKSDSKSDSKSEAAPGSVRVIPAVKEINSAPITVE